MYRFYYLPTCRVTSNLSKLKLIKQVINQEIFGLTMITHPNPKNLNTLRNKSTIY